MLAQDLLHPQRMVLSRRKEGTGACASSIRAAIFAMVLFQNAPLFALDSENLNISAEIRERYEGRVNSSFGNPNDAGVNQNNQSFVGSRTRLNVGYDVSPDINLFLQLQDTRAFGAEPGTISNTQNLDLHQGYFQVNNMFLDGLQLRVGRQSIAFGNHRVIGDAEWSNVARSFDAVRMTLERLVGSLDLIWARTRDNDVDQITIRDPVSFPGTPAEQRKGTDDQDLYIAYGTFKGIPTVSVEPYWIFLVDNGVGGSLLAPAATNQQRHTIGTRVDGTLFAKHLDYTMEGDYQFGKIASQRTGGIGVRDLEINAAAFAAKAGYNFLELPWFPRIGVEYDFASGDGDNNTDDQRGNFNTFENLFPTNHALMGVMDLMGWRNMQDLSLSFKVNPRPKTGISIDYHMFRLANRKDNWYRFNGEVQIQSSADNQAESIGQELDITAFTTVKETVKLGAGWGHFFTGEFIEKNNLANSQSFTTDQDWVYVMATVGF